MQEPTTDDGTVAFGSGVDVWRADGTRVAAPVAKALLGRRPGAIVTFHRPEGDEEVASWA